MSERFISHGRHAPQPRRTVKTTRSPFLTRVTDLPVSTTRAIISCPITSSLLPAGGSARPPAASSRSVPQIPTLMTLVSTSSSALTDGCERSTIFSSVVPGMREMALIRTSSRRCFESAPLQAPAHQAPAHQARAASRARPSRARCFKRPPIQKRAALNLPARRTARPATVPQSATRGTAP